VQPVARSDHRQPPSSFVVVVEGVVMYRLRYITSGALISAAAVADAAALHAEARKSDRVEVEAAVAARQSDRPPTA